jgi:hypothetical protein
LKEQDLLLLQCMETITGFAVAIVVFAGGLPEHRK